MPTSLIRGRYVVVGTRDAGRVEALDDAAVLQRDGRIVEVGPWSDLSARHPRADVLGSSGHVVLPGFVNAHHHIGLTPVQLGVRDDPLELWFITRMAPRDVDPYLDTLYSAFEMLRSGVTTVQHIIGLARGGDLDTLVPRLEPVLRAYDDVGMRVSLALPVRDQNFFTYEPAEELLTRLPEPLAERTRELIDDMVVPVSEQLDLYEDLARRHGNRPRARIQLAPANLHWLSDAALEATGECAERNDAAMHIHLVESAYQQEYARRRTGTTALRHLARLGLAGPHLTIGHGTWLDRDDIELAAESGIHVCHNCSSNLRLRSGIAPLQMLLAAGVNVAVGIDEAGINDDRDMLQELRMVLNVHRSPGMGEGPPQPEQILAMATAGGARTTPFGDDIGELAPGKAADLVALRWSDIAYPYLDDAMPPVAAVLHRARATAVDLVMVDGRVVVRDGEIITVDRRAALDELAGSLAAPLKPYEEERRALAAELLPHVRDYYAREYDPAMGLAPYRYNAF